MTQLHMDLRGDFDRIKPEFAVGVPRIVTFRASTVATDEGTPLNTAISVRIENGDVYGLLDAIAENGGIGVETDDGVYRFIPWPCALVEVRDAQPIPRRIIDAVLRTGADDRVLVREVRPRAVYVQSVENPAAAWYVRRRVLWAGLPA